MIAALTPAIIGQNGPDANKQIFPFTTPGMSGGFVF